MLATTWTASGESARLRHAGICYVLAMFLTPGLRLRPYSVARIDLVPLFTRLQVYCKR
jgi:hypothetical protein